jgi:hypothetical protein
MCPSRCSSYIASYIANPFGRDVRFRVQYDSLVSGDFALADPAVRVLRRAAAAEKSYGTGNRYIQGGQQQYSTDRCSHDRRSERSVI